MIPSNVPKGRILGGQNSHNITKEDHHTHNTTGKQKGGGVKLWLSSQIAWIQLLQLVRSHLISVQGKQIK
jgi:hypothetical protein